MSGRPEKAGANVHFLRPRIHHPDAHAHDVQAVHFAFRIDNHAHILRAYGPEAAQAAINGVNQILAEYFRDDGVVASDSNGQIRAVVWNRGWLGHLPLENACEEWVHSFCADIAAVPIECAGERLHLVLSGSWAEVIEHDTQDVAESRAWFGLERVRFCGEPPGHDDEWCMRYRSDMSAAGELLGAIDAQESASDFDAPDGLEVLSPPRRDDNQFALAWQPVRGVGDASGVLYYECLIRLLDQDGAVHLPLRSLEALERLGLVRALDRYIVLAVITELENNPTVTLGANISAQSAQSDGWWRDIERRLAARRSVARRLVIEITETSAMPSISAAAAFASRMHSLGCMIALDDFGTGFASIRQLLVLKPDIAKIGRVFLHRAEQSERARAAFIHLTGLANSLVPLVVVEGIENDGQGQLALEAGAVWQQGYHHGAPSLTRNWRCGACDVPSGRLRERIASFARAGRSS